MKWMSAFFVSLIAVLAPIHSLVFATGALVLLDMVTGIVAAIKRGEGISSSKMKRTIVKGLLYQLAILAGFAMDTIAPEIGFVARLVAAAIALVELKSVLENVTTVTGVSFSSVLRVVERKEQK